MSTFEEILKIDEVTTDTSLSKGTGTSLAAERIVLKKILE
jgi:hypothetical protein